MVEAVGDTKDSMMMETSDPIIEAKNVSVSFGMSRGESKVLNEVNSTIHRHEIVGIVGESGSGKSMFASALLDAVVEPGILTGEIIYHPPEDDPVNIMSFSEEELNKFRWEEVSMVFQGAMNSFNPVMKIETHFTETLDAHDYDREEGMEHARELLSDLYLSPERVLDSYPHELSGGMKQRALIALSMLLDPNLLVMDEPTAALDLLMQRSILNLIKKLQRKYDLTVIFITHDLPLVAGMADRLFVMYAFEFVEVGKSKQIIENSSHPYTRALLKAVPNLDMPLSSMTPIEGSSPDPVNIPEGCSYAPRCPLADDTCVDNDPSLQLVENHHSAACFHWDKVEDAIDIDLASGTETYDDEVEEPPQFDIDRSGEPIVSITDVSVHFDQDTAFSLFRKLRGGEKEVVHAVDDANLEIYTNDVLALVGESGSGKTTLGKAAIGIERPTDGTIEYRGQSIWDAKDVKGEITIPYHHIRRSLQMIHQDPGSSLNPSMTIEDILAVPLQKWHTELSEPQRQDRIHTLLEHVGMTPATDYAERYQHQLSGGEKQRVALLRALMVNPDLILADEAVSALDVSLRVEMMDLMLKLQDVFGTSYIFISHDLSNARYISGRAGGRIGIMYLGEIVEIGPTERVINDPRHPYTRVLKWASTELDTDQTVEDPPVRSIDIPDAINPPTGCRFHTRCPEARTVCQEKNPSLLESDGDSLHKTACFRECEKTHEYWTADELYPE